VGGRKPFGCPTHRYGFIIAMGGKPKRPKESLMFSPSLPNRAKADCCTPATKRSWYRSASGCAGSGALLVLLPKCPLCIAAYLTLWTGAGAAMSIAMHLRPALEILFAASALFLLARYMVTPRNRRA